MENADLGIVTLLLDSASTLNATTATKANAAMKVRVEFMTVVYIQQNHNSLKIWELNKTKVWYDRQ